MRMIKDVCCLLLGVGIIITGFVSLIAEGDPMAWAFPIGLAVGLLGGLREHARMAPPKPLADPEAAGV